MRLFVIISGLILLLFGKRLFWLLIAIMGFLLGKTIGESVFAVQQQWISFMIGVGTGVIGAVVAIFAQRIAFILAGFYAGTYLTLISFKLFGTNNPSMAFSIAGGIIGGLMAVFFIDWAIILLACLAGAGAVVGALGLGQTEGFIVFITLVTTGTLIQTGFFKKQNRE